MEDFDEPFKAIVIEGFEDLLKGKAKEVHDNQSFPDPNNVVNNTDILDMSKVRYVQVVIKDNESVDSAKLILAQMINETAMYFKGVLTPASILHLRKSRAIVFCWLILKEEWQKLSTKELDLMLCKQQ